jgi:hypothetical protein
MAQDLLKSLERWQCAQTGQIQQFFGHSMPVLQRLKSASSIDSQFGGRFERSYQSVFCRH